MAGAEMTLKELLWGTEVTAGIASSLDQAVKIAGGLFSVAQIPVRAIMDEAAQALSQAMDISLGEILANAWMDSRKILDAADPGLHEPDETVLVPLAEHAIHSEHRPTLEFTIDGKAVCGIEFVLDLSLQLQEVVLRIRNGRIRSLVGGSCHARAVLSCEGVELAGRETRDISLPLCIDLGEGVPIPASRRVSTSRPVAGIARKRDLDTRRTTAGLG